MAYEAGHIPSTFYIARDGTPVVPSGCTLKVETGGAVQFNGTTTLTQYTVVTQVADASAEATYYALCPYAGTISKIYTVSDGAVSTADVTVTAKIGATGITGGVVTIPTAASAAGDICSATPSAANVITAFAAVNFTVTGGGSGGSPRITIVAVIDRS